MRLRKNADFLLFRISFEWIFFCVKKPHFQFQIYQSSRKNGWESTYNERCEFNLFITKYTFNKRCIRLMMIWTIYSGIGTIQITRVWFGPTKFFRIMIFLRSLLLSWAFQIFQLTYVFIRAKSLVHIMKTIVLQK